MGRFERLWVITGVLSLMAFSTNLRADIFDIAGNHLLPHWAPIWSWERPVPFTGWQRASNDMAVRHALIGALTGIEGSALAVSRESIGKGWRCMSASPLAPRNGMWIISRA